MNKIKERLLVISPCCDAPSTSMIRTTVLKPGRGRRCIRCRQPFCIIAVTDREADALRALVGVNA